MNLLRAVARRYCGHTPVEIRNAELAAKRARRLAGKSGRRIVAAERKSSSAERAIAAWDRLMRAQRKGRP